MQVMCCRVLAEPREPLSWRLNRFSALRCPRPPMIATIKGRPSPPARANDLEVPPTPSHIGKGFGGVDALTCQRSPMFAGSVDALTITDLQAQIELFCKERVAVLQLCSPVEAPTICTWRKMMMKGRLEIKSLYSYQR
jgi:hypothetical protein